jgi:hypothetical protein
MRLPHILLAALSLFAFAGAVQARNAELIDPNPVAVPAGLSAEQVAKDIKRALIARGWEVTAEQPGQIDSTLHLREHVARIQVTYGTSSVRLAYVDSSNLDYAEKRGKRYIHGNYLGWLGFLVNDLETNLKVSSQGG